MANYEYKCSECDMRVDILKPIGEMEQEEFCPTCGTEMERILRAPAAAFVKGGGTGAGRGRQPARVQSASDTIRSMNPTDKAEVQRENVYRESGLEISDTATKKVAKELSRG